MQIDYTLNFRFQLKNIQQNIVKDKYFAGKKFKRTV